MFITCITVPLLNGLPIDATIVAAIFTFIGKTTDSSLLQVIDFSQIIENFEKIKFTSFFYIPDFLFLKNMKSFEFSLLPEILFCLLLLH